MAQFIPVPGVSQFNLELAWRNVPVANTLYFRHDDGSIPTSQWHINTAVALAAWWNTSLRQFLTNEITLRSILAVDLSSQTSPSYRRVLDPALTGALAAESVQNTNALCIRFTSDARGKGSRGRNYIPGLPQSTLVDNRWLNTTLDAMTQIYTDMRDDLSEGGAAHVVVSRYLNNQPRSIGIARTVTGAGFSTNLVATQRNRRD